MPYKSLHTTSGRIPVSSLHEFIRSLEANDASPE